MAKLLLIKYDFPGGFQEKLRLYDWEIPINQLKRTTFKNHEV